MTDPSTVPDSQWTTSLVAPPDMHIWYVADGEPTHEESAECACGPSPSPRTDADGLLYLHQTVDPNPPPAPLPSGETHPDLPNTYALMDVTQTPQVVMAIGHTVTASAVPVPGQTWRNVTNEDPMPEIGWVFDGQTFSPSPAEQSVQAALDANRAFLATAVPSAAQQLAQLRNLTKQVTALIEGPQP
jgi:hypothetical protein